MLILKKITIAKTQRQSWHCAPDDDVLPACLTFTRWAPRPTVAVHSPYDTWRPAVPSPPGRCTAPHRFGSFSLICLHRLILWISRIIYNQDLNVLSTATTINARLHQKFSFSLSQCQVTILSLQIMWCFIWWTFIAVCFFGRRLASTSMARQSQTLKSSTMRLSRPTEPWRLLRTTMRLSASYHIGAMIDFLRPWRRWPWCFRKQEVPQGEWKRWVQLRCSL